ncbi:MAG: hypothetical protein LBV69_06185, partial [Bacteroidales bacterium]|nr:hypothetical protein [Bacteroidales bacterium]
RMLVFVNFYAKNTFYFCNFAHYNKMIASTYPSITSENLMNLDFILPTSDILKKISPLFDSAFKYDG